MGLYCCIVSMVTWVCTAVMITLLLLPPDQFTADWCLCFGNNRLGREGQREGREGNQGERVGEGRGRNQEERGRKRGETGIRERRTERERDGRDRNHGEREG